MNTKQLVEKWMRDAEDESDASVALITREFALQLQQALAADAAREGVAPVGYLSSGEFFFTRKAAFAFAEDIFPVQPLYTTPAAGNGDAHSALVERDKQSQIVFDCILRGINDLKVSPNSKQWVDGWLSSWAKGMLKAGFTPTNPNAVDIANALTAPTALTALTEKSK